MPPRPAVNMSDPVNLQDVVNDTTSPPSPPTPPVPPVIVQGSDPGDPDYDFPNPVVYPDDYSYEEDWYYEDIYNVYEGLEGYYFEDNWTDYNYIYDYSNDLIQLYDYLTYLDYRYDYNTAIWWDWYYFYANYFYYQYEQIDVYPEWEMSIEAYLSSKRDLIRSVMPILSGQPLLDSIWVDTTFGPAMGGYGYYQAVVNFDPDNVYTQLSWIMEGELNTHSWKDVQALNWLFRVYGSSDFVNLLHWKVGKDLNAAIHATDRKIGEDYLYNAYYLATAVLLMEPGRNDFAELLGRIVMTFRWYGIRLG